ncbi:TIGR01777 family oxidoreductase [Marinobacter oulmenensis]|uniref:TIGR01777 family protein n=1 Tax=Marinobacter oulmenensis TaxID=643747 RepID=A0A840U607_9GAMM|nr:TIGR01777 family oxidoreductase [Marinobacter oulmenensis]MBB5320372.1 hypothetical protein [Marinobacter oulmenensis]
MAQQILITGGTGFIGRDLCRALLSRDSTLTILSRQSPDAVRAVCGRVAVVNDLNELKNHGGFDAVINLAGEGIAEKRWTEARKRALTESRTGTTGQLVNVMKTWGRAPSVLVSGSAVGYYGDQGDQTVTESTSPVPEFTHQLCRDWENAALDAEPLGVRVCISRTGLVVGRNGGFLQQMIPPFRFGLGGRLGSGRQYMPWVHRSDVVAALLWMINTESAKGAYNMVSPAPVTNQEFTQTLAKVLHRPAFLPAPSMALKLALGEMARLLLTGQRAVPARLEEEGFRFQYRTLEPALREALNY